MLKIYALNTGSQKNAKKIVIKDYEQKIKILHETGQIQKINNFEFAAICIFFAYVIIILHQYKIEFKMMNYVYNIRCLIFLFSWASLSRGC